MIYEIIGHDGSEVLWDTLPEPRCRKAFHIQELVRVCRTLGYACTGIEVKPISTPDGCQLEEINWPEQYLDFEINSTRGVIIGFTRSGGRHAVAFERGVIYDPNGDVFDFKINPKNFQPETVWIVEKINRGN